MSLHAVDFIPFLAGIASQVVGTCVGNVFSDKLMVEMVTAYQDVNLEAVAPEFSPTNLPQRLGRDADVLQLAVSYIAVVPTAIAVLHDRFGLMVATLIIATVGYGIGVARVYSIESFNHDGRSEKLWHLWTPGTKWSVALCVGLAGVVAIYEFVT